MSGTHEESYDVVIIGAGISGLICGCYLAKAGMRVVIVEQHDKPGGYFTSFRRKGFLFDAAAHSFGNYREGGHVNRIFSELGVAQRLVVKRYNPSDIVFTPDFKVTFWNDPAETIAGLVKAFPNEADGIANFIKFLTAASQPEFVKLKDKTFDHLLRSFLHDEKLINIIAVTVFGNGGLPPSLMHAFSGAKIFSEFIMDGGYYPVGGIQRLPDAIVETFRYHKGKLVLKRLVKKIITEKGAVAGVELDGGGQLRAKYVVAACDMIQTYKSLLGERIIGEDKITAVQAMAPSLSTFIVYIGIDGAFEGLPEAGTNIWHLPSYDLDEVYARVEQCRFAEAGAFMFRVNPDYKTVLAFIGAPFKSPEFWKENKKQIASEFIDRLEQRIPHLKEHIVYFDAASPATLQRYTLNHHGAAFGWAKVPSQTFTIMTGKSTSIKRLYFAGHWTSIGFGLPGTCYSGYDIAGRILRKERVT